MMGYYPNMMYGWGGYGYNSFLPTFISLLCIVGGTVFLAMYIAKHKGTESTTGRAMDILKERYAKGEINKAEFDEMKKNIA